MNDQVETLFADERAALLPHLSDEYLQSISRDWHPAKPTVVFATYWYFAWARQDLYLKRLRGQQPPWTGDWILSGHRFTNVYRAADRVSQYLINNVQYPNGIPQTEEDLFFRTLLFKVFNRIETWELLEREVGPVRWASYRFAAYDAALTKAMAEGARIFSAAYIMPSGSGGFDDSKKHRSYLRLIERMMADGLPGQVATAVSLRAVFEKLRAYPMMGDFLAFQFAIDLNYSPLLDFSERTFVVAGPGARDGIRKCFSATGRLSNEDIVVRMADAQEREFERLGLETISLWGRPLQLIDCQNVFCEVDKYARLAHPEVAGISGRTRIKQSYQANRRHPLPAPWFPPKWGINEGIKAEFTDKR